MRYGSSARGHSAEIVDQVSHTHEGRQLEREPPAPNEIDYIIEQWRRERPDLDVSPLAIIGRISRVSRCFERAIEGTFERYGLSSGGFYVLAALRRSGSPFRMSPTKLGSCLLVSGGTMTHRIDRLESARLVVRTPDPGDGRASCVSLTELGKGLVDRVMEAHNQNEHEMLVVLNPEEKALLAALLRKLELAATGWSLRDDTPHFDSRNPSAGS